MSRAVDPFEEFLRKKKVEMLEKKVRTEVGASKSTEEPEPEPAEAPAEEWTPPAPRNTEPSGDERVSDEMAEFFERGAGAGAELFAHAQELDEEQVDEIKDALEDVFEAEPAGPEVVEPDQDTFSDFFKEVQTSFDPDLAELRREQRDLAREVVQPPAEGAFEDEPLTAEFPPPEEAEAVDAKSDEDAEPEPEPMPVEEKQPFVPTALELESDNEESHLAAAALDSGEAADAGESDERLELADLLAPLKESDDLRERVEVLSRLVIKLVERADLTEHEIVEVLIKSGVKF